MGYCTLADLIAQYGEPMLIEATDRGTEATGTVDETAIARAIASADALIDGALKVRYALPLASTPALVNDLSMTIALYRAHANVASEKVRKDYEDAMRTLSQISAGAVRLDIAGVEPASSGSSGARITDRDRPMTPENMKGWI